MTEVPIQMIILAVFIGLLVGYLFGRSVSSKEEVELALENEKLQTENNVRKELFDNLSLAVHKKIESLEREVANTEDEKRILEKELERIMP